MSLKDTKKNRDELKKMTQELWDQLTPSQQYSRVLLKEDVKDVLLLKNVKYDKTDIINRRKQLSRISKTQMPVRRSSRRVIQDESYEEPHKCELIHDQIKALSNTISEYQQDNDKEREERDEKIEDLKNELKNVKVTLREFSGEIKELKELNDKQNISVIKLENSCNRLKTEIMELRESNDEQSNKIIKLEKADDKQKNTIMELKDSNEKQSNKIKILEESDSEHLSKINELKKEMFVLKKQNELLQNEMTELLQKNISDMSQMMSQMMMENIMKNMKDILESRNIV